MSAFRTLDSADLKGKRVLVRVDLNLPMDGGKVTDATRIERILPTLNEISQKGGKVIMLAHFGRPKNGPDEANSLKPVAAAVAQHLGKPVAFASDCIGPVAAQAVNAMKDGDFLLLENTRFHKGEEKNDPSLIDAMAALGDLYVNDAFSAAHRAHASTEGLAKKLPAYAGRTMQAEVEALSKALENPQRPVAAVVGGAKVSSKLELLGNLTKKVDFLIIGGGMANTFLAAQGKKVGKSLCEHDLADTAREILKTAAQNNCQIVLPVDAVVAQEFRAHAPSHVVGVDHVGDADMILDAGPKSATEVEAVLTAAKTLVWNGPFGAFELEPFDAATNAVAKFAARLTAEGKLLTVAGGGDTVAALNHAGVADKFTYVSTAGGAFLEWLEGKVLPGVEAIRA
jgi:phosphoglycerate kinase